MFLYHGSTKIIKEPVYRGGRPSNDYGYGFYCTEYPDMAREWSVSDHCDGYLNYYDFNVDGLSLLNLNDHPILSWLAVLLQNRTFTIETPLARTARDYIIREFGVDYEGVDFIRGYRADDSYFSFAQDFINNVISVEQLRQAMHLGDLGDQIVLKSERAYSHIKYIDSERVDSGIWFSRRKERDDRARKAYFSLDRDSYVPGGIYVTKILDEEIKRNDARVR